MKLKAVLAGIAAAGIAFAAAAQERPPYGPEITLDQAKKIAAGANAESKKNGWRMAIAVAMFQPFFWHSAMTPAAIFFAWVTVTDGP